MLELKTKNSHDHGTNAIGASSLPIHSSSLYSRVEDFVFCFMLYLFLYTFCEEGLRKEQGAGYTFLIVFCSFVIFFIHSHILLF